MYRFNSQEYVIRQENFGGLLFVRRTFQTLSLQPFAARTLLLCVNNGPKSRDSIIKELKYDGGNELTEALDDFLSNMTNTGVLQTLEA